MAFVAPAIAAVGAGVATVATAVGFSAAASAAIASGVLQIGSSLLISSVARAIAGPASRPVIRTQNLKRELAQDDTAPAYRFVYGTDRATGSPAGAPVKGRSIYGAWILNSRDSYLPDFSLYLDKRLVELSGDAFDFSGPGASAIASPFSGYVNCWISKGDQTSPPQVFLDEAAYETGTREDLWQASDGWQGHTVIWLKIDVGPNSSRAERWPASPPFVEVEGRWSLVYDPRDSAQIADDPSTWRWSDNHALCVRDALRQNPWRGYREDQIHPSFEEGADICDLIVPLNSGGSESKYRCSGTLVWTEGEIEDQLVPMMLSGAADFIRVGGRLGYAAGAYRAPTETLTYIMGQGIEFPDLRPGDELVNELRVSYLSPARGYEIAELNPWRIPGSLAEDNGVPAVRSIELPFCPSATQAMRVRKITGLRLRRQGRITEGALPPEALNLVGGSTLTLLLPGPYAALDGVYEVESIHPGLDALGESGECALLMPASLVKHSAEIYDFDPATEEEDVFDEPYDGTRNGVSIPGALSVASGAGIDLNTGGSIVPRFRFSGAQSDSASVDNYEWQWRLEGETYQTGGFIDADTIGLDQDVFFYLNVGDFSAAHDVRYRAVGRNGKSAWRELTGARYGLQVTVNSADAGLGNAKFNVTAPTSEAFRGVRVYRTNAPAYVDPDLVRGLDTVEPGATVDVFAGNPNTVNLFTNAGFDDVSAWALGAGWSIASGVAAKSSGSPSDIEQPVALVNDVIYRWAVTVANRTVGGVNVRLEGDTVPSGPQSDGNGTFFGKLTAPANIGNVAFRSSADFDGDIDDTAIFADEPGALLGQGTFFFWVVPVTQTLAEGSPVGPFELTIV